MPMLRPIMSDRMMRSNKSTRPVYSNTISLHLSYAYLRLYPTHQSEARVIRRCSRAGNGVV